MSSVKLVSPSVSLSVACVPKTVNWIDLIFVVGVTVGHADIVLGGQPNPRPLSQGT